MILVGKRRVEFKTKDGEDVKGYKFFYVYDDPDDKKLEGQGTDSFFLSDNRLYDMSFVPNIGETFDISYNRYGKISNMIALK